MTAVHTLLLRCVAPIQSWGSHSRFKERDTEREPTKSGIIGLLCAALGAERAETVTQFNERNPERPLPISDADADFLSKPVEAWLGRTQTLRMGVRVDAPGTMMLDYHTAQILMREHYFGTAKKAPETVLSNRYYLHDAAFLVGLESENEDLLRRLNDALANPVWPLALGRKACPPSVPVRFPADSGLAIGITLEAALAAQAWLLDASARDAGALTSRRYRTMVRSQLTESRESLRLQTVIERARFSEPDGNSLVQTRQDVPLSFGIGARKFWVRKVELSSVTIPSRGASRAGNDSDDVDEPELLTQPANEEA